jgi:uncharacterized membrane protein
VSAAGGGGAARPARSTDDGVGFNGALAATMTRAVGSMPALYFAVIFCGAWMVAGTWGPLHRVDPYPFSFLLFLNNVVQLLLCSVILVGQRVLGQAADRRSVQTYESTESILQRVTDLQGHLDRHDQALSHGLSLLDASPHPWVHRHRVQPPPQAMDQVTGANGRIAAWMTSRLGSMWAFYLSAGVQLAWIGLAALGIQRFDPYPFAFMTLLSTLVQLIFMITIMVGQDVLGRAADRRSEQTYLDAEAILHECGRMKARLNAQDRVIGRLAGYAAGHVTDHLAQAVYQSAVYQGAGDNGAGDREWVRLPSEARHAYRTQARRIGERLADIGCLMVPAAPAAAGGLAAADADTGVTAAFRLASAFSFTDSEAELLAQSEHEFWRAETAAHDAAGAPAPLSWERLPDAERTRKVDAVRQIPGLLAEVGFQVLREGTAAGKGDPGESDFSEAEWAVLHRALMAAGVLVALAEGGADPEELYALIRKVREAGISHPSRVIRELAASSAFDTGLRPGTGFEDYRGPALETIRAAARVVAARAPAEVAPFRAFLAELTAAVAEANYEGGVLGLGAQPTTPSEAAAMEAVLAAADPDVTLPSMPRPWSRRRLPR